MTTDSDALDRRVNDRIDAWGLVAERTLETEASRLVFGTCGATPAVLKVVKSKGDEWRCGQILKAFGGMGMVRVYEETEGAVLLEWLRPGHALSELSLSGSDERATDFLAKVMLQMDPDEPPEVAVPVEERSAAFRRYLTSENRQIPELLVRRAQDTYLDLSATQTRVRLLHGDLHHDNVLYDESRGWLAIDPKGLVGEPEYELGASLRNPYERPELFASPSVINARLRHLTQGLGLNADRTVRWAFSQAVLATIWVVEDGGTVDDTHPFLRLARALESMTRD